MKLLYVFAGESYKYYDDFLKYSEVGIGYNIKKDVINLSEEGRKKAISDALISYKKIKGGALKREISRLNSFFDKSIDFGIIPVKNSDKFLLVKLDKEIYNKKKSNSSHWQFRKFKLIKEIPNPKKYSNNFGVCIVQSNSIEGLDDIINNFKKKHVIKVSELIIDEELTGYEGETKKILKEHLKRERDVKFSREYRRNHGNINSCPACSFNGKKKYYIDNSNSLLEIHHIIPLKHFNKGKITNEKDVTFLCPNCHRAIHKLMSLNEKKTISILEFKKSIKKL